MPAVKSQKKAAHGAAQAAHANKKVAHVTRVRNVDGAIKTVVAKKAPAAVVGKVATYSPRTAAEVVKIAVLNSTSFGRGLAGFDLGGIGVPKPAKGKKATEAARAAGIITPSGNLAKRYR